MCYIVRVNTVNIHTFRMTASQFVLFFFSKAEHHQKAEQLEELGEDGEAFLQKLGSPTIPAPFVAETELHFCELLSQLRSPPPKSKLRGNKWDRLVSYKRKEQRGKRAAPRFR